MPTIRKRGDAWRVEVRCKGVYDSATFALKSDASAWGAKREHEINSKAEGKIIKKSVADAFERYITDVAPTHRGERWEGIRLNMLKPYLPDCQISEVSSADIVELRDKRLKEVSGASVLRELQLLSSVFEAGIEWGWCRINPVKLVKKPKANPHRDRIITDDEIGAVMKALNYARGAPIDTFKRQVGAMFDLALEAGMRAGEIEGLEWNRVFIKERFVRLLKTKTDVSRDVPLSDAAALILEACKGIDDERVFLVPGPSRDAIFRTARKSAGLEGFTFHDARHTAATRLAKKIDVLTLCKMFGWSNPKMAMVYFNPTATDIAKRL